MKKSGEGEDGRIIKATWADQQEEMTGARTCVFMGTHMQESSERGRDDEAGLLF